MATLLQFKKQYQDAETGCKTTDEAALQTCIQTYYQRQQSSANLQQENTELKTQVEEIRNEIETLKNQPTTTTTTTNEASPQVGINEYGNVIVFSLILIITILVTVILTKHFSKK